MGVFRLIRKAATAFKLKFVQIGVELLDIFDLKSRIPEVEEADRYTYHSYELRRRHMMSHFFKRLRAIYFVYCLIFFLASYPHLHYAWTVTVFLIAVSVGYISLRLLLSSDQDRDRQRSFYLDWFDYLLLGGVVYFTGGLKSFYITAFFLPLIATTLRFSIRAGLFGFGITTLIIGINALPIHFNDFDGFPYAYYLLFTLGTIIIAIFSVSKLLGNELKLSAEIYHNSVTDPLTGLFHSGFIIERIKEEIAFSKRYNKRFSIVFLDLNRFKEINDRYGHLVGDGMLRHIAFILQGIARRGETLSRYAGDEFLLLLPGAGAIEARKTLQRFLTAVESQPYFLENGIPLWITASGGIAEYPSDGLNVEQLLQVADQNMYLTKQSPK